MIHVCFDGFLLELGQGWFLRKYQRRRSRKLLVEKHRLQTWCLVRNRNGQRIPIYFDQIWGLLEKRKIRLTKLTPRYPQCNNQAETINKTILDGLKKWLVAKAGRWAEELEGILWSHSTTPRRTTRENLFAIVYGSKCIIPAEVEFPGVRRRLLPEREDSNNLMLLDELDLINKRLGQALIRIQNYQ